MKPRRLLTLLGGLLSLLLVTLPARGDELRRYGLFVGQNDGGKGTNRLLYAESDAQKMRDTLVRLGNLPANRALLLKGARRDQVLASLKALGSSLAKDAGTGRAVLYFYYSGHADSSGLKLGGTGLSLEELRGAMRGTGAALRVTVLDACQSGSATRLKGATRAPAFLVQVDEGERLEGEVVITSSAADEASQESDRVGGGYFTHHLLAGLAGGADASRDGEVTLDEAYQYAYHRTLFETAGSAGGMQHPGYQAELRGHGALVLTRTGQGQTVLVFPAGLSGTWLVFDRARRLFVAELHLSGQDEQRLALPAGNYLIQKREPDHVLSAEVNLTRGTMKQVERTQLVRAGLEKDFSKGVTEANLRRATRSPLVLSSFGGARGFFHQPEGTALFPMTPLYGLEASFQGLLGDTWALTVDFALGQVDTTLDFEAYDIASSYRELSLGVGLRHESRLGPLRLEVGPHLAGLYVRRDFPDSRQPYQDLFSMAPGLSGKASLNLWPRVSLGLMGSGHYLYYQADGVDSSLGFGEALLSVSVTF